MNSGNLDRFKKAISNLTMIRISSEILPMIHIHQALDIATVPY